MKMMIWYAYSLIAFASQNNSSGSEIFVLFYWVDVMSEFLYISLNFLFHCVCLAALAFNCDIIYLITFDEGGYIKKWISHLKFYKGWAATLMQWISSVIFLSRDLMTIFIFSILMLVIMCPHRSVSS